MRRFSLLAGIAVLLLPFGLLAEDHEEAPGSLTDVWLMVPKKGMETEFETAVKAHMAFRAEAEDSRNWLAFMPVIGHNLSVYQFRACCFEWADQDAYNAENQEKGLGANYNENVWQYVDHAHHYIEYMDWENSHWPDGESDGPYFGVTAWKMKPNQGSGPREARLKLSQMAIENGWGDTDNQWLWHWRIGGPNELRIVSPFDNYAEMAPPEQSFFEFIAEHMGSEEEASALFDQFGSGFAGSDYTVWVHRKDLSTPASEE
ncbi:MAG: hypothetical protein ACO22K_07160 [Woeseiaceae bacterium]|jgi:hypothetical protein